jgi:uncharacterized tellurite resistance protein B-like protein
MPQRFLAKVARFLEGNPAVARVAEDPTIAAELILLLRLIAVDAPDEAREIATFRAIVGQAFGIGDEDMAEVIQYLKDFDYETKAYQAAALFIDMAPERKTELLKHLLAIAKADGRIDPREENFIRRTAAVLGVTAESLKAQAGR